MASQGKGIPGLAIVFAVGGLTLTVAGLKGASIVDTLKALMEGRPVPDGESLLPGSRSDGASGLAGGMQGVSAGGTILGQAVADMGVSFAGPDGVMYRWGGHTPKGWDCSGFASYLLIQNGVDIPYKPHTTAAGFYFWKGANTIARSKCAAGDLLCWPSHIAIAIDNQLRDSAA